MQYSTQNRYINKCDAIWENPPHVAQDNFAEINKIILKLLCFSLYFINFDDDDNFGCRYHRDKN